jgi:rhomboid-like protein
MVCVDVVGALLRWRMFDHVAHLGGAAFGLFYWYYGNQIREARKLRIRDLDSQMTTAVAKRQ